MYQRSIKVLRLEVELSTALLQFPWLASNVALGVDILTPAYVYRLICVLLGIKFLPHGVHFAVQSVWREKLLHEGALLNFCHPAQPVAAFTHSSLSRTALSRRHSLLIYLDQPQWLNLFRYSLTRANPSLRRIEQVKLLPMPARYVYAEGTLLSSDLMPYVNDPILLDLPRFVDNNQVFWDRYVVQRCRSLFMGEAWIDPDSARWYNTCRGVFWLKFVE